MHYCRLTSARRRTAIKASLPVRRLDNGGEGLVTILSDAQRAAYDRDGFIVVPDVFSAAEIDELRRVTDQFVRNRPDHGERRRL